MLPRLPALARFLLAALIGAFGFSQLAAQNRKIDSLKNVIQQKNLPDTTKVDVLNELARLHWHISMDSTMLYAKQSEALAREADYKRGVGDALFNKGVVYDSKNLLDSALACQILAQEIFERVGYKKGIGNTFNSISIIYERQGKTEKALQYQLKALEIRQALNDKNAIGASLNNLGVMYRNIGKYDEALKYGNEALQIREALGAKHTIANSAMNLGATYNKAGLKSSAIEYYQKALKIYEQLKDSIGIGVMLNHLGKTVLSQEKYDDAIAFAKRSLDIQNTIDERKTSCEILADAFAAKKDFASAFFFFKEFIALKDSILALQNRAKTTQLEAQYEAMQKQKEIELLKRDNEIERLENEKWRSIFVGVFGLSAVVALFGSYRYQAKRRAEKLLQEKNAALEEKTKLVEEKTAQLAKAYDELSLSNSEVQLKNAALEKTLADLNATQQQLIQQEKLAALGELVAGVAHEIQNPLNFVYNFSELSAELCEEIKAKLQKPSADMSEVGRLLADVEKNLQKVAHHGNRAGTIVKAMLEHSRAASGEKEPTDVNALLNEYLKLAYQSYRMSHHGFAARFSTELDDAIGQISAMPRELSQVFVNLFNNAFYAMREKAARAQGYTPQLRVQTRKLTDAVEIRIQDNGVGISDESKRKIFQPFFTTKKSGEGTGLGLSISNDIIKAHGGSISVESKEGDYAEFVIMLPIA